MSQSQHNINVLREQIATYGKSLFDRGLTRRVPPGEPWTLDLPVCAIVSLSPCGAPAASRGAAGPDPRLNPRRKGAAPWGSSS